MTSVKNVRRALERQGPASFVSNSSRKLLFNNVLLPLSPRVALRAWDGWRQWRCWSQQALHRIEPQRYTDADPYKTLVVSPTRIEHRYDHSLNYSLDTELPRGRYAGYFGKVYGGDWDRQTIPIRQRPLYNSIKQVYQHGYDWEDTEQYEIWMRRHSPEEVVDKCANVDRLWESFSRHGYIPQRELVQTTGTQFPLREPVVNIGRDGELIHFRDGNHRLCLAKLLELDTIVVRVGIRHTDWQATRDAFASSSSALASAQPASTQSSNTQSSSTRSANTQSTSAQSAGSRSSSAQSDTHRPVHPDLRDLVPLESGGSSRK